MPFSQLGFTEILLILFIVLLVFGAKRLPEMGSALGKGIREFKKSIKEVQESVEADTTQAPPTRRIDAPVASSNERDGEPKKLSQ
jgi:sec-independent protein translocase protein TatA